MVQFSGSPYLNPMEMFRFRGLNLPNLLSRVQHLFCQPGTTALEVALGSTVWQCETVSHNPYLYQCTPQVSSPLASHLPLPTYFCVFGSRCILGRVGVTGSGLVAFVVITILCIFDIVTSYLCEFLFIFSCFWLRNLVFMYRIKSWVDESLVPFGCGAFL